MKPIQMMRNAVVVAMMSGLVAATGAGAQEASPVPEGGLALPPPPVNCTVVAEGLWAPRFIAVGDDGAIYVTEVGVGGEETLDLDEPGSGANEATASPVASDGTPVPALPAATRGYTGQVTKIAPDGTQSVLVDGLPSYSDGVGPAGIVFFDGMLYVAIGGAGVGAGIEPLPEENAIYQIDPETGDATILTLLGPYEAANNPDATDVNPNLYDITASGDKLYVNDAGGNAIYEIDPATGQFLLLAVVPGLAQLTGGDDRQPVPTGIAPAPDGGLYIALLSEAWPADAPSVLHMSQDGTFSEVALGLSGVVDVGVGPDGAVYATQLTSDFASMASGDVVVIDADGAAIPVVEGLLLPHGVAWGADGSLYVTTVSLNIAAEPMGSVLNCAMGGSGEATPTS